MSTRKPHQVRTSADKLNLLLERGTGFEPATSTLGRLSSGVGVFTDFASTFAFNSSGNRSRVKCLVASILREMTESKPHLKTRAIAYHQRVDWLIACHKNQAPGCSLESTSFSDYTLTMATDGVSPACARMHPKHVSSASVQRKSSHSIRFHPDSMLISNPPYASSTSSRRSFMVRSVVTDSTFGRPSWLQGCASTPDCDGSHLGSGRNAV
jgi:hypothetical protein